MIRISIEVRSGGSFCVTVRAPSIYMAMAMTEARFPGTHVEVLFPIEPEAFFVRNSGPGAELEMPEGVAG